jgi:hypothetical protein
MRSLIAEGEVGALVSTTMTGFIPIVTADGWPHVQTAFLDLDSGISRARGVLGHSKFAEQVVEEFGVVSDPSQFSTLTRQSSVTSNKSSLL